MLRSATIADAKKRMTVATKIAIQINAKLGGATWKVKFPKELLINRPLFIGIVRHPMAPRAIECIVYNRDVDVTSFCAKVIPCDHSSAANARFTAFGDIIKEYIQRNGVTPGIVMVHQLEEKESAFPAILDGEVNALRDAISEIDNFEEEAPAVVYVVASKMHATRFFTTNLENPVVGTVVDRDITSPFRFEFYLASNEPRQTCLVVPTRYTVLEDSQQIGANVVQSATHALTHLYYNWTGSISMPATLQYGVKLGKLITEKLATMSAVKALPLLDFDNLDAELLQVPFYL